MALERSTRCLLVVALCGVGEYAACRLAVTLMGPARQILRASATADLHAAGDLMTGIAAVLLVLAWSWLTGAAMLMVTDVARGEKPRRRLHTPVRWHRVIAALLGTSTLCLPVAAGAGSPASDENGSRSRPAATAVDGLPLPDRPRGNGHQAPETSTGYRVVDGDTLWGLTRLHLGPAATDARVARTWPLWYAANQDVIGPDPHLLIPGTVLQPPGHGARRPGCSTSTTRPAGEDPAPPHGGRP
jgi:hypothetical protein